MTDPLTELRDHARRPAPELAAIVERGRRRRQTRVLGAGVATAALGTAIALAISSSVGATSSSSDRLLTHPGPQGTAATQPTPGTSAPGAAPVGQQPGSTSQSAPPAVAPSGDTGSGAGSAGAPQDLSSEAPAPAAAPAVDSRMHRDYDPNHATVELTSGQLCTTHAGTTTGDDPYCAIPGATTRKPGVVEVSVLMCRDGSQVSDGTLTFDSDREVDFAVYRGSALLWRWSDDQPAAASNHHVRAVARGKCWVWWTQWAAVDDQGRPLTGTVTVRATSNAAELAPDYRTTDYEYTL